jgi:Na+/H+ antiporter NhaD/arsenite permease-like protein
MRFLRCDQVAPCCAENNLAGITVLLSNIVSNVPAVLLLKSFVPNLQDPLRAWLVVAMAATLAGNFTLVALLPILLSLSVRRREAWSSIFGLISR